MSTFQVSISRKDSLSKIHIGGSLDVQSASGFNQKLKEEINRGFKIIVVNMENLAYISSAGLGVLINANEHIQKSGGELRLCGLSEKVKNIFRLLGFINLFKIFDSEKEATE
jgi:anti-sigma B factor antagonist